MTDQPTNPTPNPDSDDAIRVSDDLAQHPRLKSILSPAQEPLPLGARVIVVRSFPNDHDLGMGDLGTVASLTDNPELWDKPGVQFDRAPYVIIKNPVMGHSIWEYVREVTKSPDPDPIPTDDPNFQQALEDMSGIPAWKRPLLIAKQRVEAAAARMEDEQRLAEIKFRYDARHHVKNALERFGIKVDPLDMAFDDVSRKAFWMPQVEGVPICIHAFPETRYDNGHIYYAVVIYQSLFELRRNRAYRHMIIYATVADDVERAVLLDSIEHLQRLNTIVPHDMGNDPEDESDLPFSDPEEE